ncbi:MAG: hypothetical protein HQL82_09030 [Magnetococcales bacterium]|nr:hypothetical protein [Magnetococcales bacterium]
MKHFHVNSGQVGYDLSHRGHRIAEGLTREEAVDAAQHLERLFYQTPLATFADPVAFETAVCTGSSLVRSGVRSGS